MTTKATKYSKILILLTIMLTFVFLGCIQRSVYPSEKETIDRDRTIDLDGDGIPDQIIYTFQDRTVGTVTVHREILVKRKVGNIVVVRLNIISNATDKISNIVLQETIPTSLASSIDKLSFSPKYSELVRKEPPITVVWRFTFGSGGEIGKTIEYTVTAFQEINRAWIDRYAQAPSIEVEVIDPKAIPIYVQLSSLNKTIYEFLTNTIGFYLATAAYTSIIVIVFLVLIELFMAVFAYVRSTVGRTEIKKEYLKLVGHGKKDNQVWIALGILLAILGTVAIVMTEEIAGTGELTLVVRLASNVPKTIGIAIFVLGIVSIYYVLADMLKGIVLGERYFLVPIDMARARLKQLLDTIDRLDREISQQNTQGIDTEPEEIVMEVERNKAERIASELNEENAEYYVKPLVNAINNVQTSIDSLENKIEVLTSWPMWRKNVDDLLITKDSVTAEMLTAVPSRWRKWALTRYLSEHLGEALTIEEGILKKIKIAAVGKEEVDLILTDFMRAGKIEGMTVMRKDGLTISSFMPKDVDPNLIAAMGTKVMANAEMSSMELEKGRPKFVLIKAGDQNILIYSGKSLSVIAIVRSGESVGFVISEMEKLIEKLNTLI